MSINITSKSHLQTIRRYTLQMVTLNENLKELHDKIAPHIDPTQYEAISAYVNQYISHTHIWNIKFTHNLENPEVALMQLVHLQFILTNEPAHLFKEIRIQVADLQTKFQSITLYSATQLKVREHKMKDYLQNFNSQQMQ